MKITFLNKELKKKVYMTHPEGFTSTNEFKMCKLQRSIYELKQASRSWNMYSDKMIRMYGFIRNGEEPYIYKWANDSIVVFVILLWMIFY